MPSNRNLSYEDVWELIEKNEGKPFYTKRGIPFSYHISGTSIIIDGTRFSINNKMLRHVYQLWPVERPSDFDRSIQKSSYVWAIFKGILPLA